MINVTPNIDLDDSSITMAVRPTVTNVDEFVNDPGVDFVRARAGIQEDLVSQIPVVQVQEIDSIIKMNSGEVMVMGGLLRDRNKTTTNTVPVLGELPFIGKAFSHQSDTVSKSELVIFLKTTILEGSNVHDTDKDLYKLFSGDRRPLKM